MRGMFGVLAMFMEFLLVLGGVFGIVQGARASNAGVIEGMGWIGAILVLAVAIGLGLLVVGWHLLRNEFK